ncbi:Lysine histidine transporter 1 [Abeliophyllum distichum]|uniref:Lysine histidine transporter 1 n=1 Tax=Abeliophyllum distichum TaxID=126358 RepID=A0ABD1TKZ7_9LAMI
MNDRLPRHNQDLENWLPITASHKAKCHSHRWCRCTRVTICISQLGWIPGIIAIAVSWLVTFYSVISTVSCVVRGSQHHEPVSHGVRSHTTAGIVFDVFNSMGTIAFAFAGHSVALEIQATIPSTPEKMSKKPMWQGVIVAYIIVAICYFSVGISGFWAFGDRVDDDVLVTLQKPRWVICTANFMVFLHVLRSYQVFAMPVFDMIECCSVKKFHFTPGWPLRLVARSLYVVVTAFIAICVPFFGGLIGFFGGLAFTSISYFIPSIICLIIRQPARWGLHWIASWVSIIVGVLITLVGPIGGARYIVLSAKDYKMFS